jgi:hypothetical protein
VQSQPEEKRRADPKAVDVEIQIWMGVDDEQVEGNQ